MEYLTRDEVWLLRAGVEELQDKRNPVHEEKIKKLWHKVLNIIDTKQEVIPVHDI